MASRSSPTPPLRYFRCPNPDCDKNKGDDLAEWSQWTIPAQFQCFCGTVMEEVMSVKKRREEMMYKRFTDLDANVIIPSRWQPRDYPYDGETFDELKESIRVHGVQERLRVFINEESEYELIAGHRRRAAALEVGFDKLPVEIVRDVSAIAFDGDQQEVLRLIHGQVVLDNLFHEDLTPIEEARAMQGLIDDHGYTQEEVGHIVSRSQQWVSERLSLLQLAPAVQTALTARAVEFSTAREIAKLPLEAQVPVMERLKEDSASARDADKLVKKINKALEPGFWDLPEDEPLSPEAINIKRLIKHWLEQLSDEEMGEVLTRLEQRGILLPPHQLHDWDLRSFASACQKDGVRRKEIEDTLVELGRTCENCLWREHQMYWQCGQDDRKTCVDFLGPEDPVRLPVPDEYADDCDLCLDRLGWCTDVACCLQHVGQSNQEYEARYDKLREDMVAKAQKRLLAFYEEQLRPDIDSDHWLAQPCERCGHFLSRGDVNEGPCGAENPTYVRTELWTRTGPGQEIRVPRCSGFLLADVRTVPEMSQKSTREIAIAWLREQNSQWQRLGWLYDGPEEKLAGFLKQSDLTEKQLAALMTMIINEAILQPSFRMQTTWKQIDPVTGGYSTWKLWDQEPDEHE